jgi:hypothetical protein
LRQDETCADMMTGAKHFIPCFRRRNVCSKCKVSDILPCYVMMLRIRRWANT